MSLIKYKLDNVNIKDLKFDDKNPNQYSAAMKQGLDYSMDKFGYVDEIIVDQNNMIANGEHRVRSLIAKGVTKINVKRFNFKDDNERKLFRQAMNKIQGQHDPKLDSQDILSIIENNDDNLLELMSLTAEHDAEAIFGLIHKYNDVDIAKNIVTDQEALDNYEEEEERVADPNPVNKYAETYLHGNIKQLMIYFTNEEYKEYISRLQKFMTHENIKSHTDMFKIMVDVYDRYVFSSGV